MQEAFLEDCAGTMLRHVGTILEVRRFKGLCRGSQGFTGVSNGKNARVDELRGASWF